MTFLLPVISASLWKENVAYVGGYAYPLTYEFSIVKQEQLNQYLLEKVIKIYHDFVHGQGNPPECQRSTVMDETCRVMDVANLWHEGNVSPTSDRVSPVFQIEFTMLYFPACLSLPRERQLRLSEHLVMSKIIQWCDVMIYPSWRRFLTRKCFEIKWGCVKGLKTVAEK